MGELEDNQLKGNIKNEDNNKFPQINIIKSESTPSLNNKNEF